MGYFVHWKQKHPKDSADAQSQAVNQNKAHGKKVRLVVQTDIPAKQSSAMFVAQKWSSHWSNNSAYKNKNNFVLGSMNFQHLAWTRH